MREARHQIFGDSHGQNPVGADLMTTRRGINIHMLDTILLISICFLWQKNTCGQRFILHLFLFFPCDQMVLFFFSLPMGHKDIQM